MRKITISTALDFKRKEHPIYALFSDSEGAAPFLKMKTQKLSKTRSSYVSTYKKEINELKGNLINKHKN